MVHLSNTLSCRSARSGGPHTRHIFIASSYGQIVNTLVPSGPRHACPIGPWCAGTLTTRRRLGYACTASPFVSGVRAEIGRSRRRALPEADGSEAVEAEAERREATDPNRITEARSLL